MKIVQWQLSTLLSAVLFAPLFSGTDSLKLELHFSLSGARVFSMAHIGSFMEFGIV